MTNAENMAMEILRSDMKTLRSNLEIQSDYESAFRELYEKAQSAVAQIKTQIRLIEISADNILKK